MNRVWVSSSRGLTSLWRVLPLVAFLTLGLVITNVASAAGPAVPFYASISGSIVPPNADGDFSLSGSGFAGQLGIVKNYSANGSLRGPNTTTLVETLTAANGDTLTIHCDQALEVVNEKVLRGTDTWTVIGGTGRFAGASGSGTGETVVDLNTGVNTFSKKLTGTISY